LPGDLGGRLLDAAQDAFTQGLQVVAVVAAGIAISTAVLAAIVLRRTGTRPPDVEPVDGAVIAQAEAA
jgi:DHA2 family multidrug resistance protein-like MFS transporter